MDIFESDSIRNHSTGETPRLALGLAERSNVLATRRSRTREVSSRYKSPIPSAPSSPRRCQSPHASRTLSASSQLEQKRALSAERKRPSTPPSPTSPSTSDHDLSSDLRLSSRRTAGGRSAESLWPSTMRSLNVSFQSDIISIPVSKKEKPVPASPSDRTLRPSSNFAHKLVETPMVSRKPTPERKRSPLKGKNVPDQLENSKPIDGLHTRLIDQRRTSRIGRKISLNALSRSGDLTDKIIRSSPGPLPGIGLPSLRRTSSDSINKLLPRSNNDSSKILPLEDGLRMEDGTNSVDNCSLQAPGIGRKISLNALSRSGDHIDKIIRSSPRPLSGIGLPSLRRTSSDSINKLLPRSNNDSSGILPLDDGLRMEEGTNSVDNCSLRTSGIGRKISLNALSRSVDNTDKIIRSSPGPLPLRRTSSDSINKLLPRSNNDSSRILPLDDGIRMEDGTNSVGDCSLQTSRIGKKISLNAFSRSVDHTDKIIRNSPGPLPGIGSPSLRRTSSDSINKLLLRSNNDSSKILPLEDGLRREDETNSVDDGSFHASGIDKKISLNTLSRSVDHSDKIIRSSPGPLPGIGLPSLRRTSSDSINKLLPRSNNDSSKILPLDDGLRMEDGTNSVDDCSLQASEIGRKISLHALSRSVDHTDKIIQSSPGPLPFRRTSSDSINKLLPRSNNDSSRILPLDDGLRREDGTNSVDDCSLQALGIGRKISLNALSQSMDHTDKIIQSLPEPLPRIRLPSSRRTSSNSINKLLQRSDNDSSRILPLNDGLRMEDGTNSVDGLRMEDETNSVDDCSLQTSGIGRKISLNALSRSVDLTDKIIQSSPGPPPEIGLPSLKRTSSDSINKLLQRSDNDSSKILPLDDDLRMEDKTNSVDDCSLQASGIGRKISLNALSQSVDLTDKIIQSSPRPHPEIGLPLLRSSSDSINKLLISDNDSSNDGLRMEDETNMVDDCSLQAPGTPRLASNGLPDRLKSTPAVRSQSLTLPGLRLPSPIRTSVPSSSVSRGSSPARPRPSTPPPRGVSPSRIRPTNSIQSNSSTSVLSFIADFKGKKGANYIEDSHQMRLLYNRYMQWRFSNARAEAIHDMHKVDAERTLCNVWKAMIRIWDSVTRNRIDLHMLKLELKLNEIMNDQMSYLDEWDSLERDHINSLSGVLLDLKANTLRVPLTAGATADVESLKGAIGSALNVMRVMASSICSLLSQVERMNGLASELAAVASQEKAMLDECESLLASTTAMQVEEHSLRTHLIQMKQSLENTTLNLLPHKYNYHTTFLTPRQRS
ncbi:uncharacterized protein LOC111805223 isoform X2 [Cucurbita pepo subsp. pepo]|uniref:uncharacterized protein LOC111805223 isoform X2 n=1 Tax=Cucurbita pepo subsp. pepo TaxID=3664 RepID=UPI000C9D4B4B|nr:uncharacterized protein LOC111805223 isoform X2 [Cucurbita pepo subsp. pepo]